MLHYDKEFYVSGEDFTEEVAPKGYSVQYSPVDGGLGGIMTNGTTMEDEIAQKAIVTVPFMLFSEERMRLLVKRIYSTDYPTIRYYDLKTGGYRKINIKRAQGTLPNPRFVGMGSDGVELWACGTAVFEEK